MDRREALQFITALLGGALVGSSSFIAGCKADNASISFSEEDIELMNEIANTILPDTDTPGAKAANVGDFMATMVVDCYDEASQQSFISGLQLINKLALKTYDVSFVKCLDVQKNSLLEELDMEQKLYTKSKAESEPAHYFRMVKELTLLGFFTSEIGCTQAKRYLRVPGRYVGCVAYKVGDKAIV